jgi:glycosyltransferase involved in cell wall biosynthesis
MTSPPVDQLDPPRPAAPIRVLHLSPSLDQGGLEKLQVEFARYADRGRFRLQFLALQHGGICEAELRALGSSVEILDKPPGLRPRTILDLARAFRRLGVDVLHTHNNGPLIYGPPAARLARIPVVVHTRHHGRYPGLGRREIAVTSATSRLVDRVVCVSEDSRVEGLADGIQPHRLRTILNGIDIARFGFAGPCHVGPMVSVARLHRDKNLDSLIRAARIMIESEPGFRLEIAGEGDHRGALEALIGDLGVADRVKLLGNVDDIPGLLGRARALILPSLSEGMSVSLLEGMASGLPVVATRVGGNPEIVAHDETGLLVPPADDVALARAMLRIWRDPELGRSMGAAGRARVERHFDIRRMVADHEALYLELLGRRRKPVWSTGQGRGA